MSEVHGPAGRTARIGMQDGLFRASKRPVLRFKTAHVARRPLHRDGGGAAMPGVRMFSFTSIHSEYALPYCFTPAFFMMRCVVWLSRWCCSEPFFQKSRTSVATVEAGFVYATFMHHRHRPSSSRGLPTGMHSRACSAVMAACLWPLAWLWGPGRHRRPPYCRMPSGASCLRQNVFSLVAAMFL